MCICHLWTTFFPLIFDGLLFWSSNRLSSNSLDVHMVMGGGDALLLIYVPSRHFLMYPCLILTRWWWYFDSGGAEVHPAVQLITVDPDEIGAGAPFVLSVQGTSAQQSAIDYGPVLARELTIGVLQWKQGQVLEIVQAHLMLVHWSTGKEALDLLPGQPQTHQSSGEVWYLMQTLAPEIGWCGGSR